MAQLHLPFDGTDTPETSEPSSQPVPNTEENTRHGLQHVSEPLKKILEKYGLNDEEADPEENLAPRQPR